MPGGDTRRTANGLYKSSQRQPPANKTYTARRDGEEIGRATRLGVLLSDLEAWARTQ